MKKTCVKCKISKPSDDFHERQSYCKPCIKKYIYEWCKNNRDKIKEYTQKSIKSGLQHCTVTVYRAVKSGKLANLKENNIKCYFCAKNRATIYEHRDYQKPLQVKPCCSSCNRKIGSAHKRIKINSIAPLYGQKEK